MPESRFLPTCLLLGALLGSGAGAQAVLSEPTGTPATAAGVAPLGGAASVTVQPGDTAFSLARRAGLSVADLLALNHLSSADLRVGQVLTLRAEPVTYAVQPGDTLYALARRFGVTQEALMTASALPPGAALRVGQVLTLPPGAALAVSPTPVWPAPAPAAAGSVAPGSVTAASGLGATPHGGLLPAGALGSPFQVQGPVQNAPVLSPGPRMPTLTLPPTGGPDRAPGTVSGAADWRASALSLLNTPYVLGGTTRTGTDCSGLVLQVFTPLGVSLPRTSAEQARMGLAVSADAMAPGDLVFFDTEGAGRVTHVGIYLGEDQFISANSYQGRVTVDRLRSDRYWAPRFVGARRVLDAVTALGTGR